MNTIKRGLRRFRASKQVHLGCLIHTFQVDWAHVYACLALCASLFVSHKAMAFTPVSVIDQESELAPRNKPLKGWFGIGGTGYINSSAQSIADESTYSSISGSVEVGTVNAQTDAFLDLELRAAFPGDNAFGLDVPQGYVGTGEGQFLQFYLGRRFQNWSQADQEWTRGQWEPRFRWDFLNPQRIGLTGLFVERRDKDHEVTLFASPFFVPELANSCSLSDGEFSASSPWCIVPPSQTIILGQQTPNRYTIDEPSIESVVIQPSFALAARVGAVDSSNEGLWGGLSGAYKPYNQLGLGLTAFNSLVSNSVEVTLFPRVVHHQLITAEGGYQFRGSVPVDTWTSVTYDRPVADSFPSDQTVQVFSDSLTWTTQVYGDVFGKGWQATRLGLGYLLQSGGIESDQGQFAQGNTVFEPFFSFRNALKLSAKTPVPLLKRLLFSTSLTQDFSSKGAVWSSLLTYQPETQLTFALGADVLGTTAAPEGPLSATTDFLHRYQANDRVHGGVSYVF